ncbi:probable isoaspartyl peptidase/L-asparaginase GA20639 [Musca vetustissima]|uniref:probable isoaspartyl peptidase/L-asparaginase GA20639 n=1 Tax=Musca vetustissima TaxID=27455 RepID=UPI002AB6B89D|nr:probable isoaspartyl peptidase/L-asparaginase GA20639 [Musca vetustissima]
MYHEQPHNIVPTVLLHGGAGDVTDNEMSCRKDGIKQAARLGYATLMKTQSVVDAVQQAVEAMESDPQFNCGRGSVLTSEGTIEMDAGIMDGATLNAGCVSTIRDILHPIALARSVMENTPHTYMAGEGAMVYARKAGFQILPPGSLVTKKAKISFTEFKDSCNNDNPMGPSWRYEKPKLGRKSYYASPGTVGAVAIDSYGNVAAATSTGGLTGKMSGRIGDSPILGAGTYADNMAGCISATGSGEIIMRYNVASRILGLIKYCNMRVQDATKKILDEMLERFQVTAGLIAIHRRGNLGIYFTTDRMAWAYQRGGELHCGVDQGEDSVEEIVAD